MNCVSVLSGDFRKKNVVTPTYHFIKVELSAYFTVYFEIAYK